MADTKITSLTELTAPADADELIIVDDSDTTMAATGTDKRISYANLCKDDLDLGFESHRLVHRSAAALPSALAVGTYCMYQTGHILLAAAASSFCAFYVDPADYPDGSRTAKVRLRAWVITCSVQPLITFTFHLYPVATWGGGSNVRPTIATVGASVCSAAIASPAAGGPALQTSSVVNFPAAGWYTSAVALSAQLTTNAPVEIGTRLEMQQI